MRGGVILLLLGALGVAAWWWSARVPESDGTGGVPLAARRRGTAAVAVEATAVAHRAVRDVRRFFGTLQPHADFDVAPRVAGRLQRLLVDLADRVQNGQVVARLDDEEYVQQVNQARAELAVARASVAEAESLHAVARRSAERVAALNARGIASAADLENAQAQAEAHKARVALAAAQVTQREAALRAAEVRLSYTVIRVQWHGTDETRVVGARHAGEGDTVNANQPLLTVLALSDLTAVLHAAETDYPLLREGQPVALEADAYAGRTFPGRVARIAPRFDEASRQARVEVTVPNRDGRLKPGMFVSVAVEVARESDATVVPRDAVVTRDERRGVFLLSGDGTAVRFVPVTTGIVEDTFVQVRSPALSGRVVTLGQHLLSDGSAVTVVAPGGPQDTAGGASKGADGSALRAGG